MGLRWAEFIFFLFCLVGGLVLDFPPNIPIPLPGRFYVLVFHVFSILFFNLIPVGMGRRGVGIVFRIVALVVVLDRLG